jgi:hypothetical protein
VNAIQDALHCNLPSRALQRIFVHFGRNALAGRQIMRCTRSLQRIRRAGSVPTSGKMTLDWLN